MRISDMQMVLDHIKEKHGDILLVSGIVKPTKEEGEEGYDISVLSADVSFHTLDAPASPIGEKALFLGSLIEDEAN